jgi:hypothetical protein
VAKQRLRPLRILLGTLLMLGLVAGGLAILAQYAGAWGVPYFTFTSDRGSPCTNNFTGYICSPVSLDDVVFYGDVKLPADTKVISGSYRSTHDYMLQANMEVPQRSEAVALKALNTAYGKCIGQHPYPMPTAGLTKLCVIANDTTVTESGEPSSRIYTIGTGVRKDGTRVIALNVRSR